MWWDNFSCSHFTFCSLRFSRREFWYPEIRVNEQDTTPYSRHPEAVAEKYFLKHSNYIMHIQRCCIFKKKNLPHPGHVTTRVTTVTQQWHDCDVAVIAKGVRDWFFTSATPAGSLSDSLSPSLHSRCSLWLPSFTARSWQQLLHKLLWSVRVGLIHS